jgi:hypothetical protein
MTMIHVIQNGRKSAAFVVRDVLQEFWAGARGWCEGAGLLVMTTVVQTAGKALHLSCENVLQEFWGGPGGDERLRETGRLYMGWLGALDAGVGAASPPRGVRMTMTTVVQMDGKALHLSCEMYDRNSGVGQGAGLLVMTTVVQTDGKALHSRCEDVLQEFSGGKSAFATNKGLTSGCKAAERTWPLTTLELI